ncbi:MAG: nucleotidyltransferase, partial [Clostridia bacterium]|nr:nucleotidyltransferase [Clostridia bacterium]
LNKCEFYSPLAVQMVVDEGGRLRVYSTPDKWFGVTYITDKPVVIEGIAGLTDAGLYPRKLW